MAPKGHADRCRPTDRRRVNEHDGRDEALAQARARAHSLAAFYASGGVLNIASSAVPGWHPAARSGLLVIAAIALGTALGLFVAGHRAGTVWCQALLATGSVLIAGCMISAGRSPMAIAYAFFFCWVSIYAANWWGRRSLTCHLSIALVCEAGSIALVGPSGLIAPACLVTIGACAAAGVVVQSLRRQVRDLALRDPLTGALNRRGLAEQLLDLPRRRSTWTVVALDLDGFKAYNDSRGHADGDDVLRRCVSAWTALLGPGEACARLGGDEFVLICRRPPCEIELLVADARACVPQPLSVSVGTATAAADEPAASVFSRADTALYLEKAPRAMRRDHDSLGFSLVERRSAFSVRPNSA